MGNDEFGSFDKLFEGKGNAPKITDAQPRYRTHIYTITNVQICWRNHSEHLNFL